MARNDDALISRLRTETPGAERVLHFNNAGCSLPAAQVVTAQIDFLRRESELGGYEAAEALGEEAQQPYRDLARRLRADEACVGFCNNASDAWRRVLYGLPLKSGARVVYDESTYGGNILALLDGRDRFGWELVPVRIDPTTGTIDQGSFLRAIEGGADLVALTHMAAQCGAVNDIAQLVRTARSAGAFTLLDACQTLGQVPIDFASLGLDSLIFTGRKYLRAPRGTGGFVFSRAAMELVQPLGPDIRSAAVLSSQAWERQVGAIGFEQWERNWAVHRGLAAAIEYWSALDEGWVWERIQLVAAVLTEALCEVPGVEVRRLSEERGGIVVFDMPGHDLRGVRDRLRVQGINTMYAGPQNAPLQMARDNEHGWLRASVHYYNTEDEVDQFAAAVSAIAR